MSITLDARRAGPLASINVTPMIDVLLVLLIIFMVLQEQLRRGLSLQVPVPEDTSHPPPPESLVLEVGPGGVYRLNQQPIAEGGLRAELSRVFAERNRKVIFVKAEETAAYREVIAAVDESRAAGATVVGLVPRAAN